MLIDKLPLFLADRDHDHTKESTNLFTFFAAEYTENTEKCRNFLYFLTNKLSSESGPVPQGGMISVA